jgi:hypothetical protein
VTFSNKWAKLVDFTLEKGKFPIFLKKWLNLYPKKNIELNSTSKMTHAKHTMDNCEFQSLGWITNFFLGSRIEMDLHKFFIRSYDTYFLQTLVSCSWVLFFIETWFNVNIFMFEGFILLVWFETWVFCVLRFQSTQKKHHGFFVFLNCVLNLDSHNTHCMLVFHVWFC